MIYGGIGYVYDCKRGIFQYYDPEMVNNSSHSKVSYRKIGKGCGWETGDTIEFMVDLRGNNSWIQFIINNRDYGIVYDNILKNKMYFKNIQYRLIVHFANPNAFVELVNLQIV